MLILLLSLGRQKRAGGTWIVHSLTRGARKAWLRSEGKAERAGRQGGYGCIG